MSLFFEAPITIVGQGLAGSLLAWTLLQQGKAVRIFAGDKPSASRVAAGLINPVTGQRFVLANNTPEMLTYAKKFYQDIETRLNIQCFHEKPMFRLFSSQKEQENCEKRLKNEKYDVFLDNTSPPKSLLAEHGGITQNHTAWLDTNILLDALHTYFEQLNIITYRNFEAETTEQHVIYCEGYHMMFNPLFSWLPLQPAHGEIITCDSKQTLPDAIINKGKWLLPTSQNTCRIGATFDTKMTTPTLLESSKQQLLAFAEGVFSEKHDFNVVEHQAGIRPTTLDKQPFIGFHPKYKNIAIFNGFGSRGSLMIPWYSQSFSQTLINNTPIPKEASIHRFKGLLG
ncbi:MAG: FAD-binding oxidoreductase [Ghiorsea sp.]|nr:FAD-binding oxidoreductase [Ghiorsea sp.]